MRNDRKNGTALTPEFLWAQRKDLIYLTLAVPNVKKDEAKVTMKDEGRITFTGAGGVVGSEREYALDIALLKGIKSDESQCKISPRNVIFKIKKTDSGPYWERLLKESGKNVHCKIDWNHWIDEDDEDESYSLPAGFDSKDHEEMDFAADGSDDSDDDGQETVL